MRRNATSKLGKSAMGDSTKSAEWIAQKARTRLVANQQPKPDNKPHIAVARKANPLPRKQKTPRTQLPKRRTMQAEAKRTCKQAMLGNWLTYSLLSHPILSEINPAYFKQREYINRNITFAWILYSKGNEISSYFGHFYDFCRLCPFLCKHHYVNLRNSLWQKMGLLCFDRRCWERMPPTPLNIVFASKIAKCMQ